MVTIVTTPNARPNQLGMSGAVLTPVPVNKPKIA